jgi:hypothetical protein
VGDAGTYHLDLRFPSAVDVSGRVVDEQGNPLQGAELSLAPVEDAEGRSSLSTRSVSDGSFRFRDVSDGVHRLSGRAPGHLDPAAPEEVVVAGREVGGLVLRLARDRTITGTISGRVLGSADEDWPLLRIEALREEEATSPRSMVVRDRTYRLSVAEADGFAPAAQDVVVTPGGTTEIQVVLERGPGG